MRNVLIDKTEQIEDMLTDHIAVCLSGMPGVGRRTAVRILLEKHPEVNPVYCTVEEIRSGQALKLAAPERENWYLIRKPERSLYPDVRKELWQFIHDMKREDRIFLAVDGVVPESFLEFVWNGVMAVVMPETFWFTEAETFRYLKGCKSQLKYREVQSMTGGWAGCIAMLVRLEKQLKERWTVWELCSRYEVRKYIQTQIIDVLPQDEKKMLMERALFPYLNEELVSLLWGETDRDLEEKLFVRGAMMYIPGKHCWHAQPALRIAIGRYISEDVCEKAVDWYEAHGYIQDALICCWHLGNVRIYRECLIRNYDKVSFLHCEHVKASAEEEKIPELFYLEWMQAVLRQDKEQAADLRKRIPDVFGSLGGTAENEQKKVEIYLNIAYTDPEISTEEWMELLREKVSPGHPIRLYYMLGETVSFLCGLRDLSPLFACGKHARERYQMLWQERLAGENQIPFRLAQIEYDFQTDAEPLRGDSLLETFPETDSHTSWQIRLGLMYLAYLLASGENTQEIIREYIRETYETLRKEEVPVCRWNARALMYLAQARWGEKEQLIKWIRETGGEIENEEGQTKFYMAAEVKIALYLGNYGLAESMLQTLIPYFQEDRKWRWLAEALFQRAVIEWERKETGYALKTVAESFAVANPYRYVKIYTGYGNRGAELLQEYQRWTEGTETTARSRKKKYKYGNVLRMPTAEWLDYILRKAVRQKKYFPDLSEEQQNIYRVEKLTVTEQMVLQYLEKGFSNVKIGEKMNVKLTTVKSHIYNIYKKLGVKTRVQAVQKAREAGML